MNKSKITISELCDLTKNTYLLLNSNLVGYLPTIKNNKNEIINCDFISYYYNNHSRLDIFLELCNGSKIFEYPTNSDPVDYWHQIVESITLANIDRYARLFALENIGNIFVTDTGWTKTDTLGATEEFRTYGQQTDTFNGGKRTGTSTQGARSSETAGFNRSYELENLEQVNKATSTQAAATDTSEAAAYTDSTIHASHEDSVITTDTINKYVMVDNSNYYQFLDEIKKIDIALKDILNDIIKQTGVYYEY